MIFQFCVSTTVTNAAVDHLGSRLRSNQASFAGFMNTPSPISFVKMLFDMMPNRVDKLPEACSVLYISWKVEWDQGKNNLNNNWIKFAITQNYEVVKLILHFWYEVNRVKIISGLLSHKSWKVTWVQTKKKSQIDNRLISYFPRCYMLCWLYEKIFM